MCMPLFEGPKIHKKHPRTPRPPKILPRCMSHPLSPTKAMPVLQIICTSTTPKIKKAKPKPPKGSHHTPLMTKALDFSFFAILSPEPTVVPHDSTHARWQELGPQLMPDTPRDNVCSNCSFSTDCSCEAHSQ